jgi:hypothetical protein
MNFYPKVCSLSHYPRNSTSRERLGTLDPLFDVEPGQSVE